MQSVKSMVVAGCLLIAATAHAWEWDDEDDLEWGTLQRETPEEFHQQFMADLERQRQEAIRQQQQLQPWYDYNRQRSACEAIGGNDAARADCFRGLGGW